MIQWREALAVGHEMIDADHKHLLNLINLFEKGAESNIEAALLELVRYTHSHFAREELLQQKAAFPFSAAHKKLHEKLLKDADALMKRWEASSRSQRTQMVAEIGGFLRDWLVDHIIKEDMKMKRYIGAVAPSPG